MRALTCGFALLVVWAPKLLGQGDGPDPDFKNPKVARAIAFFIPGGGHVYANAAHIGVPLFVGTGVAIGWGYASDASRTCYRSEPGGTREPVRCTDKHGPSIRNGFIVAGAFWLFSFLGRAPGRRSLE